MDLYWICSHFFPLELELSITKPLRAMAAALSMAQPPLPMQLKHGEQHGEQQHEEVRLLTGAGAEDDAVIIQRIQQHIKWFIQEEIS